MPNSFTIAVHGLPVPDNMAAGKDIESVDWRALTGCINHAHAHAHAQPVWAQAWGDSQHQRGGVTVQTLQPLRVPILSTAHTTMTCEIYATVGVTGGGTVYFTSSNTGSIAVVPVAASGYHSATLTGIGTTKTYDTLFVYVQATSGTIIVTDLAVNIDPLTSPLTTSVVDSAGGEFLPFGDSLVEANHALSAALGRQAVDNLNVLNKRPRSIYAWAGLVTTGLTPAASRQAASPYMQRTTNGHFVTAHLGAQRHGVDYTAHAYVMPHSTNTTYLRIVNGQFPAPGTPRVRGGRVEEIVVATGTAATWVTATFPLVDTTFGRRGPLYAAPGVDRVTTYVAVDVVPWANSTPPDAPPRQSNARVYSLTVMGR